MSNISAYFKIYTLKSYRFILNNIICIEYVYKSICALKLKCDST